MLLANVFGVLLIVCLDAALAEFIFDGAVVNALEPFATVKARLCGCDFCNALGTELSDNGRVADRWLIGRSALSPVIVEDSG